LEALTSLETTLHAALGAAALAVAAWSAVCSFGARTDSPKTGEIAWTAVAVAVLACVTLAAGIGHGV
jgi:hypothetical protein